MAKGQSALEYMMTYGWAILIIVIVAVILYSMGIFNPRASVTIGSSGFSPFVASAAVCNSTGLTVAFSVGGLPGGATSVLLTGANYSSATGISSSSDSFSLPSQVTVSSGDSFELTATGDTCNSGTPFSASGKISYTVNSGLSATYTATGTIAGTGS